MALDLDIMVRCWTSTQKNELSVLALTGSSELKKGSGDPEHCSSTSQIG